MKPNADLEEQEREARERMWRADLDASPPSAPAIGIVHGLLISVLLVLLLILLVQHVLPSLA